MSELHEDEEGAAPVDAGSMVVQQNACSKSPCPFWSARISPKNLQVGLNESKPYWGVGINRTVRKDIRAGVQTVATMS